MARGLDCGVCGNARSRYIMNNKLVCLRCDELLFDIEIECEEEAPAGPLNEKLKARLEKNASSPMLLVTKKS